MSYMLAPNPWDDPFLLKTFVDTKNIIGILMGATFTIFTLVAALLVPESPQFGLLGGKLIIYLLLITFVMFLTSYTSLMRLPAADIDTGLPPNVNHRPLIKLASFSQAIGEGTMVAVMALITYIFIDYLGSVIVISLVVAMEVLLLKITIETRTFTRFSLIRALSSSIINIGLFICISLDFFGFFVWSSIPF